MNLAIRGIEANLGEQPADSFPPRSAPDLKGGLHPREPPVQHLELAEGSCRQRRALAVRIPPAGNANFAWIQHFIHHLAPSNGRGGGTPASSWPTVPFHPSGGEGEIRRKIVEADLVDCIVGAPAQLFLTTGIPVCLWFLTRDKTGKNLRRGGRDRRGETLFIDARALGSMQTRTLRTLSGVNGYPTAPESDIGLIVGAYHSWRGELGSATYADVAGFWEVCPTCRDPATRAHPDAWAVCRSHRAND